MDEALRDELVRMIVEEQAALGDAQQLAEADEQLRNQLGEQQKRSGQHLFTLLHAQFPEGGAPAAFAALFGVNERNVTRLNQVVDNHGWPGRAVAGEDGADAAWLIALHADRHVEFRRSCIPLLVDAVAKSEADPRHLSMLTDRVRLCDGRPQLYGSNWREDNGEVLWLGGMEEPSGLDARRSALGLPPFSQDRAEVQAGASLVPCIVARTSPGNQWPPKR